MPGISRYQRGAPLGLMRSVSVMPILSDLSGKIGASFAFLCGTPKVQLVPQARCCSVSDRSANAA
jgi:hypothetical protein